MDDLMGMMQELLSDPESMKQIQELTQMLQSEFGGSEDSAQSAQAETQGEQAEGEGGSAGFDFGMLFKLQQLMQATAGEDKDAELLLALKPHLKEERQKKVDKAVKILKLLSIWSVLRDSGMLKDFL